MHSMFFDDCTQLNSDSVARVLLIGETGAGKSTIVNYLTNYFRDGTLASPKIAIPCKHYPLPTEHFPHCELDIDNNTLSKTNACLQYMFTDGVTRKQYVFLDTPGLCDTRGKEQNELNLTKILDAITELGDLTAIIIVVNGSLTRLTRHLRTIISLLNGNLPDVVLENVIVVLTNAKKHESPFDLNVLNLRGRVYPFHMQNSAFMSDPSTWHQSTRDELQEDWDHSLHQIKSILETIDSFHRVSTESFARLKHVRNEIRSMMHQVRLDMIQLQNIYAELSRLDHGPQQTEQDTSAYQERIHARMVEKLEMVDAAHFSTICAECNQVCHSNCRLDETVTDGAQVLAQCSVMHKGRCQECPNHCPYQAHYHAKKVVHVTRRNLHDTLEGLRKEYRESNAGRNDSQGRLLSVIENKKLLERLVKQKIKEIRHKSLELCSICSSVNLAREFRYLIKRFTSECANQQDPELQGLIHRSLRRLKKIAQEVEDRQKRRQLDRPTMQIIDRQQPMKSKPVDLKSQTTARLVELCQKATEHSLISSIMHELHQRAQGKSINPLTNPEHIQLVSTHLERNNHRSVEQLSYAHRKLHQRIQQIIDGDILKLVQVQPELFLEIFAVQTLLDKKEAGENAVPELNNNPTKPSNRSVPYPVGGPTLPEAPLLPNGFSSISSSRASNPESTPSSVPPSTPHSPASNRSSLKSKFIGFSGLNGTPYPSQDASSPMPALPDHFVPTIETIRPHELCYPREGSASSPGYQFPAPMPMPMPTTDQFPSNEHLHRNGQVPPDAAQSSECVSSSSETPSKPDVVPIDPTSCGSPQLPRAKLINGASTNLNRDDLKLLDNRRLLFMFAIANLERNDLLPAMIHQELERRCRGDHPMLIAQQNSLVQEKLAQHSKKSITELAPLKYKTEQKIREYLKNDDVTLIEDVPPELIVEAHVFNLLVDSKSAARSFS